MVFVLLVVLRILMPFIAILLYMMVYRRVGLRGYWLVLCLSALLFTYVQIWPLLGVGALTIPFTVQVDTINRLFGPLVLLLALFPLAIASLPNLEKSREPKDGIL